MKKLKILALSALAAAILIISVSAANDQYDSSSDPIISQSGLIYWYENSFSPAVTQTVLDAVNPLKQALASAQETIANNQKTIEEYRKTIEENQNTAKANQDKIAALEVQLAALAAKLDAIPSTPATPEIPSVQASGWETLYLPFGTTLFASTPCDIIFRAGVAIVVSPFHGDSAQGISDTSDKCDLLDGTNVPANHYLVIPRGGDGRGIRITSEAGAYVMVRGGYELVQP